MEKQFQEVFPDLRIEGGMAELLDTVEVSRVSINKKKDLLRIYVVSPTSGFTKNIFISWSARSRSSSFPTCRCA